jgi:hypothetical protein
LPRQKSSKLTSAEFKSALRTNGFAALPGSRDFLDVQAKGQLVRIPGVVDARRRLRRRETLAALLAARIRRRAQETKEDAARAAQSALAASLAPVCLPPPRGGLEGAAAIHQLADDFIVMQSRSEGAEFKHMLRLGWTAEQLTTYADDARALADTRQNGVFA